MVDGRDGSVPPGGYVTIDPEAKILGKGHAHNGGLLYMALSPDDRWLYLGSSEWVDEIHGVFRMDMTRPGEPGVGEALRHARRHQKQVGIVQIACPELYCLGLGRRAVRPGLESPPGMRRLRHLIDDLIFTIREYLFQGFTVVGILGKNGSPSCGVTRTYLDNRQQDGQGVFIRELKKRLAAEKLDVPVVGVADHDQDQAVAWLERRLRSIR